MKKKLILLPLVGLLLTGCSINDIMFWKTKENDQQQNGDSKDSTNQNTTNSSDTTTTTDTETTDPGTTDPGTTDPVTPVAQLKTIKEVKDYIKEHPVEKNSFGNGVNTNVSFKVRGYAVAKIDTKKSTSTYGLDVSYPGKVILADETGCIAAASPTGGGLWTKVDDKQCLETSKYEVTGYISECLGHPELKVTSYEWKSDLNISWNVAALSPETVSVTQFYEKAKSMNYNCGGHGYGDVVTINNLKCYYMESPGSGKRYYNFTDANNNNIRVNAFNLGTCSVDSYYSVTGIMSMETLSPIIVALKVEQILEPTPFTFDYESVAQNIEISDLKKICGSQDDTDKKYPNVVEAFNNVYKTTGYLCNVVEGNAYLGLSDVYYSSALENKLSSMTQKNVILFENDYFWGSNSSFETTNETITVYYVLRKLNYKTKKAGWQVLLIPDFVNSYFGL